MKTMKAFFNKKCMTFIFLAFSSIILFAQDQKDCSVTRIINATPDQCDNANFTGMNAKMIIRTSTSEGLNVRRIGTTYGTATTLTAIGGASTPVAGRYNVGVAGATNSLTGPLNSGRATGVQGSASNTTSGYNYGVVGILYGNQYGTGIYGGFEVPQYIAGQYAGYFDGNVRVVGNLTSTTSTTSSDLRYKKNVEQLSSKENTTLRNILNLNPVKYNLIESIPSKMSSDTATVVMKASNVSSEDLKREHFGLIAQEVQVLYPDLVYADGEGYLSVNYIGLIPILIEGMKEQQRQIEELKAASGTSGLESVVLNNSSLRQNTPNPFSSTTEIRYALSENTQKADLYIYNMQGMQIKSISNLAKGVGSVIIEGSELSAGMYIYTLIADGKEVDTKRMILTK